MQSDTMNKFRVSRVHGDDVEGFFELEEYVVGTMNSVQLVFQMFNDCRRRRPLLCLLLLDLVESGRLSQK